MCCLASVISTTLMVSKLSILLHWLFMSLCFPFIYYKYFIITIHIQPMFKLQFSIYFITNIIILFYYSWIMIEFGICKLKSILMEIYFGLDAVQNYSEVKSVLVEIGVVLHDVLFILVLLAEN